MKSHIPRMDNFCQQLIKTHNNNNKKWTGMQNDVVQPNVNEVKQCQSTRNKPQPQQKKFHFLSHQLSNVLQLLPYIIIYLQKGERKKEGNA